VQGVQTGLSASFIITNYELRFRPFHLRFATTRLDGRGYFIVTGFVLGFVDRFYWGVWLVFFGLLGQFLRDIC